LEAEELLELALDFFGLPRNFTEEEFRNRYHELAKKYHPDVGEFTSTVLFNELQISKQILESYLQSRDVSNQKSIETPSPERKKSWDPAFELYKISKELENQSILDYYEKTKGNPIFLKEEENPPLRELRFRLQEPIRNYQTILERYPTSIWARDARDSIRRLRIWTGSGRRESR